MVTAIAFRKLCRDRVRPPVTLFPGFVPRLERGMTPKRNRSGDPSEPVDRSVLEVLIRLNEPGPPLSGQRVDACIEAPAARASSSATDGPASGRAEPGS